MTRVWKAKVKVKLLFTYVSPLQLTQCNLLTNIALRRQRMKETTTGEKLKYFGTLIYYQNLNFVNVEICGKNISKQDMFLLQ